MIELQKIFVVLCGIFGFCISFYSYYQCKYKKNAYGPTPHLYLLSIYVWGDGMIFGSFFGLSSLACLLLDDWILFLLIFSVFHLVRSVGEAIYWFNEQFAVKHRNAPEKLPYYTLVKNDSIWFIYQIAHQCIAVVTIITSVYLFHLWLQVH